MTQSVFDPGLQAERTLLAWRRTCLSFALVSLMGMRFTIATVGVAAVLAGVGGAGMAVIAYVAASFGYQRAHDSLHQTGWLVHSGWPVAFATGAALLLGIACAAYFVTNIASSHL